MQGCLKKLCIYLKMYIKQAQLAFDAHMHTNLTRKIDKAL